MKKTKKKYLIILLVVLLLGLAVGYAAFSDTLLITGTASAGGTFDVKFIEYSLTNSQGIDTTNSTVVASNDDDTLTVTVAGLSYPGAGTTVHTKIKNVGSIPAKVKSVTATPASGTGALDTSGSGAIKIDGLQQITTSHPTIDANGTCTMDFVVYWDENVNTLTSAEENGVTFNLTIEYEQDTTSFTGTKTHSDS